MSWLLDTNVISELRKVTVGREVAPTFHQWASEQRASDHYLSAVTVYELELGVGRIERRSAQQGRTLRRWLDETIKRDLRSRILPLDAEVASLAAELHHRRTLPDRDSQIAATAHHHSLGIVTRNVQDFQDTGLEIINPWQDPALGL